MRLLFAHQLRAVAVLCVVASHYLGVYWNSRDEVAAAIMARPPAAESPAVTRWLALEWFNPGAFGVALFFLISGFVIPFSLQRLPPARFLVARAWRIFPTYWAGLGLGLAALWLMSAWSGEPFAITPLRAVSNGLLIHQNIGQRSIDRVNWTLAAELKFYLLMAALAPWVSRIGVLVAAGAGIAGLGAAALAASGLTHSSLAAAAARSLYDLSFLPYMLIGTLFWLHWRGRARSPLILAGLALATAFAGGLAFGPLRGLAPVFLPAHAQALLAFTAAYALRARARSLPMLDGLASISYPLYALHALVGYCVMTWALAAGASPYLAIGLALAAAIGLAVLVHRTVERWSVRRGHRAPAPTTVAEAAPAPLR